MFRPVAAPFAGSMKLEDPISPSAGRALERCFASLAIGAAAAAAWLAAELTQTGGWRPILAAASCALLAVALLGLWCTARLSEFTRTLCGRIYAWVLQQQDDGCAGGAVRGSALYPPVSTPFFGLAQLMGDLVMLTRRQQRNSERLRSWQLRTSEAVQAGRAETDEMARQIARDAGALAAISDRIEGEGAALAQEIAGVSAACSATDQTMSRATDRAVALAGSVRATTASAVQMTGMAAELAQVAHSTQTRVAALAEHPARLVAALDAISNALRAADGLAQSAAMASASHAAEDRTALARELKEMAAACRGALSTAMEAASELLIETGEINRRVHDMGEAIRAHHEMGHAVGYAVQQQSEDISGILDAIYEARSGFLQLRAGVNAVEGSRSLIATTSGAVRDMAASLPNRAETLASILRGIPDFAPRDHTLR